MDDRNKEMLLKQFSNENISHRYQQAVNYFINGGHTGGIDYTEYKVFKEQTLKRDVVSLAHAYLNMLYTFDEYFEKLQTLIGFDLMIQGCISGTIKAKKNGKDDEEEIKGDEVKY